MIVRSIRLRLTLWYVGILMIILSLFGGILYINVAGTLYGEIDALLAVQAEGVSDSIFMFWRAEWESSFPETPPERWSEMPGTTRSIQRLIDEENFPELVNLWAQEFDELEGSRSFRILSREGDFILASSSFKKMNLSIFENAVTEARQGKKVYQTFVLPKYRIRLITWPVVEDGRVLYIIEIAYPLRQTDASLRGLRLWIFWLIPLTLLAASFGGWFLATKALRPVGDIIAQARRISVKELHERIGVPKTGDELELLAVTFNNMLARLEQVFKRIRQFSAAASHELRTPLTIMKGELEVALRKPRPPEEYQRALNAQLEALNEMIDIVEQLLMLARSEESQKVLEQHPLDLKTVVNKICDAWQGLLKTKEIHLKILSGTPVWTQGEQRLLERLISNLLDNAAKHTPPHGTITVELSRKENYACLTVQDNGPGIPSGELSKIFEKFFSRHSKSDGTASTGLGLGLCRWIAEVHRGRIDVSSSPGKGALFTVLLPAAQPPFSI